MSDIIALPMNPGLSTALLTILAYLLGTIPFALIFSKMFGGIDPSRTGNSNPGAANVFRKVSKKAGIATGVGDAAKALIPITIARALDLPVWSWTIIGIAATLGHCYPFWNRFKGGMGLSTGVGMAFAMLPIPCLIVAPAAIAILVVTKNVGWSVGAAGIITLLLAIVLGESIVTSLAAMVGVAISLLKAKVQPMKPVASA